MFTAGMPIPSWCRRSTVGLSFAPGLITDRGHVLDRLALRASLDAFIAIGVKGVWSGKHIIIVTDPPTVQALALVLQALALVLKFVLGVVVVRHGRAPDPQP